MEIMNPKIMGHQNVVISKEDFETQEVCHFDVVPWGPPNML